MHWQIVYIYLLGPAAASLGERRTSRLAGTGGGAGPGPGFGSSRGKGAGMALLGAIGKGGGRASGVTSKVAGRNMGRFPFRFCWNRICLGKAWWSQTCTMNLDIFQTVYQTKNSTTLHLCSLPCHLIVVTRADGDTLLTNPYSDHQHISFPRNLRQCK